MALAATDSTIAATAVPQIVGDLGGFSVFSWLFSVFSWLFSVFSWLFSGYTARP
jgi:hypothetical protein